MGYFFLLVALVLLFLLISKIIKTHRWFTIYRKSLKHLNNIPSFKTDAIGCYMRFSGQLTHTERITSPLFAKQCVFYWSQVIAIWKTKQKKPGKDWDTHKKRLLNTLSAPELILSNGQHTVFVKVEAFAKTGYIALNAHVKEQNDCPKVCIEQAAPRYETYQLQEIALDKQAMITVYGQLMQDEQKLYLVPTEAYEYPSLVYCKNEKQVIQRVGQALKNKIRNQVLKQLFLIVLIIILIIWSIF